MNVSSLLFRQFVATRTPDNERLVPEAESRFLLFDVGSKAFGIPFTRLAEVRTLQNSLPVLHAPDYGSGVVALNGRIVAVIDLRVNFDQVARFDHETRLVVVFHRRAGRDDELVGLLVDRVQDVVIVDPALVDPVPDFGPETDARFILGTMRAGDRHPLLLNVDALIET